MVFTAEASDHDCIRYQHSEHNSVYFLDVLMR